MNLALLAWRYLWSRPLLALLNLALLALGCAAIVVVTLVSEQLEQQTQRNLAGIDLVVGAKGSPLQLILAGVFHIDSPTGNIPLATQALLAANPLVASVVPLSLGDSVKGFRIVGTSLDYLALYATQMAAGRVWQAPMEALLGADAAAAVGVAIGGRFAGGHGLGRAGDAHEETPYTVVGTLRRCDCVLDRLVLTATESVWQVHEHGDETPTGAGAGAAHDTPRARHESEPADAGPRHADRELTLLLVRYRSPLAAASLPRWVNAQPGLQAAAPALESARLFRLLGAGLDLMRGFGLLLVLMATLSLWVALTHAVREREADLAMLRMLGAPPRRVAALLIFEALWLALIGVFVGLLLGHGLTHLLGLALQAERSLAVTGLWWSDRHAALVAGAVLLALLAVAWPVRRVMRLDVTTLLQQQPR